MADDSPIPTVPPDVLALDDWLLRQGLEAETLPGFFDLLVEQLLDAGMDLSRLHIALAALDPIFSALGCVWHKDEGSLPERYARRDESKDSWLRSPIKVMVEDGLSVLRRRLTGPEAQIDFPVLEDFRERGATDWLARLQPFGPLRELPAVAGMILTATTERPEGFTDRELAAFEWLMPRVSLVAYRLSLRETAETLLDAYVGPDAGRRILAGQIERGAVERLEAVLLFADLRGFTAFAEATPPDAVLAALNARIGAVADAVAAEGGQVLKFIGDGLLATFPLEGARPESVTARALEAALSARAAVEALNASEPAAALALDQALHLGEVLYGNVGSERRLDFTVIGPAVNQASRLEALCEALGQPILLSGRFAQACDRPLVSLGDHRLRGLAESVEVFAPVPQ